MRTIKPMAVAGALLLLAGCAAPPPEAATAESRTVSVQQADVAHTVMFERGSAALAPGEWESIAALLEDSRPMGLRQAEIEGDARTRLGRDRMNNLRAALARQGVPYAKIRKSHSDSAAGGRDEMSLTMSYMVALPPRHCPDWSKHSVGNFYNTGHSNAGCATKANLAAQVADPGDLLRGNGDMRPDNSRSTAAIGRYRKIEPYGGAEQKEISVEGN